MARKKHLQILILLALILCGIALQTAGLLEPQQWLDIARNYADQWWLILIMIILQAVLFTFALAGSTFLWIVSPIYKPEMATFILVAGGTLGGISAYYFSRRLTDEWVHRVENSRVYRLLQKEDNFFSLFALRLMPAFPHALINYSSGMLHINIWHFIAAAILGLSVKCYVFSGVIYQASSSASLDSLMDFKIYGPLIAVSLLVFTGIFIKYQIQKKRQKLE